MQHQWADLFSQEQGKSGIKGRTDNPGFFWDTILKWDSFLMTQTSAIMD